MESSKVEMIEQAIQQLMTTDNNSLPAGDEEENRLLLSRLLTQLQTTENVGGVEQADTATDLKKKRNEEITDGENGTDKIVKEIKKVQRQNFITHCLLSAMIFLTITWQLSEVSLILKVKNGINNPFRAVGGLFKDLLKGPTTTKSNARNGGENQTSSSSQILAPIQQHIEGAASLSSLIPDMTVGRNE